MTLWQIVGLLLALSLLIFVVITYNKLIRFRNYSRNGFSQIDVQLTRRYDLIPNLVKVASRYLEHEKSTLESVMEARNHAKSRLDASRKEVGALTVMNALSSSEGILNGALGGLFATVEAYPDLKANEQMEQLMEQLIHTENRIAYARQGYNDSVMHYNILRESFPNNVIAALFRFRPMAPLELDQKRAVPEINLS